MIFRLFNVDLLYQELLFALVAIIVKYTGIGWINKLFPPAAMEHVITIIGLELC